MPHTKEESNKRIAKTLRKSVVKAAIAESAGATASTSNHVSQSTESTSNSVALSKAFKKLRDIDLSINIDEQLDNSLIDYIGRTERYTNHLVSGEFDIFQMNEIQRQQVDLAAKWAVRVHKITESSVPDTVFKPGSPTGNERTFCLHKEIIDGRTILVIAFRATRYPLYSPMEMAVNTNADPMNCEELGAGVRCHRGLYRLAKNMERLVAAELEKWLVNCLTGDVNVLFTGHSSGAAIAQLLFAFTHSDASPLAGFKSDDRITYINCVTFGGPPISEPPISRPPTKMSLFVAFINEGDPIALAQESYVQSLIQAWTKPVESKEWAVPLPLYIPSGDQVVLRCEIDERGDIITVVPLHVGLATLETVLFGDLVMHSMSIYGDRIRKIMEQAATAQDPFQDL